jgi:23S rRNA pseudouridine1911/1915/1917 synthase
MQVVYEDNHIIIVNKQSGEIVQGDKTGDTPLSDIVKAYIKEHYAKPGQVFLGVTHRLDRPVSGVVVFARTSKALSRMNNLFRDGGVEKTYLAIVADRPPKDEGEITSWLTRNERLNKSFSSSVEKPGAKLARLRYRLVASTGNYHLLAVRLLTGRHHQIRCQLASIGCPIKGDLKYGARRSNPDGSISLHAWRVAFEHPVSHKPVVLTAPCPIDPLWGALTKCLDEIADFS